MKKVDLLIIATYVLTLAIVIMKRSKYLIHMLQLEGYKNNEFKKWIKNFSNKAFDTRLKVSTIVSVISISAITFATSYVDKKIPGPIVIIWVSLTIFSLKLKKEKGKKDIVYTKRVKRLFVIHALVNIVLILGIKYLILGILPKSTILISGSLVYYLQPYILLISNILAKPIENSVNKKFYTMAQDKIKDMDDLKVVGITGSYGKTSVKFFTDTILNEKYKSLKTPESYNTPMGVSKVINETLDSSYEVFVSEMGARNVGDISEMAELVGPKIGVLTSVGPAHLDTFKTVENIAKTKYELIEKLPEDGIAIFNYDNKYIKSLADDTKIKKILYGIKDIEKLDVYGKDISVSETGSEFILGLKTGEEIKCNTKLLGEHNIQNILASASVGVQLGMSLEEISKGISKIEPVPHRLELIVPGTGVIIIDDAFNSNPAGAKAAVEVLSNFKEGRKIVITPGMIELGDSEYEENKIFGGNIGKYCDYAILVGENRTKAIQDGILETDFSKENLFIVNKLDDAVARLQTITKPKDIVLFENDLPDNYNE